jgi:hypothetical protein
MKNVPANLFYWELYPIFLLFSVSGSLPTLVVCFVTMYYLNKTKIHPTIARLAIILIPTTLAFLTIRMIGGSWSQSLATIYSLVTLLTGIIISIKTNTQPTDNQLSNHCNR